MEKLENVNIRKIFEKIFSSRKSKMIVGTILLSGIGIAFPRIFHVLVGSTAGATFFAAAFVVFFTVFAIFVTPLHTS